MTTKIKPHYDPDRTILADVVPLPMPYSIQCEASQVCNLKCNYCMQSFIKRKNKHLMNTRTFSNLCAMIDNFGKPVKQFNFAGWGEPLCNPLIAKLVKYLKGCRIADNIAIITNGLLLNSTMSENLLDAGVDHIRISLQGITPEAYKKVCGKGIHFDKFVENIEYLYKIKGESKISIKVADIALEEFEDEVFYNIFGPITDQMYIESIRPMFKENKQDGKVVSKYGIKHPPVLVCPQPFFMMSVTATGDIFPCCSYYDPAYMGNIEDMSLRKAWVGKKLNNLQRMLLTGNRKKQKGYPVCRDCQMPDAVITPGDELDERKGEILGRMK